MNEQFEKLYEIAEATGNLNELEAFLKNIDEPDAFMKLAVSNALKCQLRSNTCKFKMVHLLLKHGADPNFDSGSRLPLQIAVQNPHITLKVIKLLLEYGAYVVGNFDKNGYSTVLQFALQNSNITLDIVKLLLEHSTKANNGVYCIENVPLLLLAVDNPNCNSKFVKLLLKYGADVNARGVNNDTPLHIALIDQCLDVIETLLMHGADMNLSNDRKITPLQDALKRCCDMRRFVDSHLRGPYDISQLYCNRKYLRSELSLDMHRVFKLELSTRSMLKHIVIRKTDCDFEQISNSLSDTICKEFLDDKCCRIMDNHYYYPSLRELLDFLISCVQEVAKMKYDLFSCCFNLQEFILFRDKLTNRSIDIYMDEILRTLTENSYPIYKDAIMSVIKKRQILTKISYITVYARSGFKEEKGHKKQVYLDLISVSIITKYLSKEDLLQFALAFFCYKNREGCKNKQKNCPICLKYHSCDE